MCEYVEDTTSPLRTLRAPALPGHPLHGLAGACLSLQTSVVAGNVLWVMPWLCRSVLGHCPRETGSPMRPLGVRQHRKHCKSTGTHREAGEVDITPGGNTSTSLNHRTSPDFRMHSCACAWYLAGINAPDSFGSEHSIHVCGKKFGPPLQANNQRYAWGLHTCGIVRNLESCKIGADAAKFDQF